MFCYPSTHYNPKPKQKPQLPCLNATFSDTLLEDEYDQYNAYNLLVYEYQGDGQFVERYTTGWTPGSGYQTRQTADDDGDFGDGMLVFERYEWIWDSQYNVWAMYLGGQYAVKIDFATGDTGPTTVTDRFYNPYAAAEHRFVYIKDYEDPDGNSGEQVWLWDNGSVRRLTSPGVDEVDHGDSVLAMDENFVVYDKWGTQELFYWNLNADQAEYPEYLLTQQVNNSEEARMDGNGVVWRGQDPSDSQWYIYYAFLQQSDIAISSANLTFSSKEIVEGDTIDVSILVRNLTDYNLSDDITVRLYDGAPDAGGGQLGSDQVISGGLAGNGQQVVDFTGVVIPDGAGGSDQETLQMYIRISVPGFDNPDNNTANGYLTVYDNDTEGPLISNVLVEEYNGDGDGIIGADEQIRISWNLSDLSGIGSTELLVDGSPISRDGDYYAIFGPVDAGEHNFVINATDADASPASSEYDDSFSVLVAEEIAILCGGVHIVDDDPTPIDVGDFLMGANTDVIFIIRNDGDQMLTLGDLVIQITRGNVTYIDPVNASIPGGSTTYFFITPETSAIGPFSCDISLINSDSDENPFNFSITGTVQVGPSQLRVDSLEAIPSGFVAHFNRQVDPDVLNLYDTEAGIYGPADFTVEGNAVGPVAGSLIYNDEDKTVSFIKTSGTLKPDTYTVTLRSGENAFKDSEGHLLDGDGDGVPGEDYVATVVVEQTTARLLSVPDFTRGPGQDVNVPAMDLGIPVTVSDGSDILALDFVFNYDPALLSVTGVSIASGLPSSWGLVYDLGTPGHVAVTIYGPTPLGAGEVRLVEIEANVPNNTTYASAAILGLSDIQINEGTIAAKADCAIQVAAYFGDATGNHTYSGLDAAFTARVAVGLDGGFAAYRLKDPVIVADVTGNGQLSGLDASYVARKAVGLEQPEIPDLPNPLPGIITGGLDPLLSIPENISAYRGSTVTVPILVDDATGLFQAVIDLQYDTNVFDLGDDEVNLANLTSDWNLISNVDGSDGHVRLSAYSTSALSGGCGSIVELEFNVRPDAALGVTVIDLLDTCSLNEGALVLTLQDGEVTIQDETAPPTVFAWELNEDTGSNSTGQLTNDTASERSPPFSGIVFGKDLNVNRGALRINNINPAQVNSEIAVPSRDFAEDIESKIGTTEDDNPPIYINDADLSIEYAASIEIRGCLSYKLYRETIWDKTAEVCELSGNCPNRRNRHRIDKAVHQTSNSHKGKNLRFSNNGAYKAT